MQDPTVDPARLSAKTSGATVVDLLAYKNASAASDDSETSQSYISPRLMRWLIIAAVLLAVVWYLRIAR